MNQEFERFEQISRTELRTEFGIECVSLTQTLLNDIVQQTAKYPATEEGGILVGLIEDSGVVKVVGFIESGPGALRTRGSLHSDLKFQESVFIELLDEMPDLEHLGSWHSHHCVGLPTLSSGDLESYYQVVNSPNHAHDYYFAILLVNLPENPDLMSANLLKYFRIYLMTRGNGKRCYRLDEDCILLDSDLASLQPRIDDSQASVSLGDKYAGSWFRQAQAREMITADSAFFNELLMLYPSVSEGKSTVVRTPTGWKLKRCLKAGGYLLEYLYPEENADCGLELRLVSLDSGATRPNAHITEIPCDTRHSILIRVVELLLDHRIPEDLLLQQSDLDMNWNQNASAECLAQRRPFQIRRMLTSWSESFGLRFLEPLRAAITELFKQPGDDENDGSD